MVELNQIQHYLSTEFSNNSIKYEYETLNGLDSDKLEKIKIIKYKQKNLIILANIKVINEGVNLSFINEIIVMFFYFINYSVGYLCTILIH